MVLTTFSTVAASWRCSSRTFRATRQFGLSGSARGAALSRRSTDGFARLFWRFLVSATRPLKKKSSKSAKIHNFLQADADNGSPCQSGFGYRGLCSSVSFGFCVCSVCFARLRWRPSYR